MSDLPPTLLKEAEAAAEVFERDYGYGAKQMRFIAGARWLFTRLLEMSEGEFDAGRAFDDLVKPLADTLNTTTAGVNGARYQHALSQTALLKAKEEIARLNEVHNGCVNLVIQLDAERARCERYKTFSERWSGHDVTCRVHDDEPCDCGFYEARQALSGDE